MLMQVSQGNIEEIKPGGSSRIKYVFKALFQQNIIAGLGCSEVELVLERVIIPCSQHVDPVENYAFKKELLVFRKRAGMSHG